MSDLIKRLREHAAIHASIGYDDEQAQWERDLRTVADEIERLTAENQHLRQTATCSVSAALHEAALAELRGENERLIAERDELRRQLAEAEPQVKT